MRKLLLLLLLLIASDACSKREEDDGFPINVEKEKNPVKEDYGKAQENLLSKEGKK